MSETVFVGCKLPNGIVLELPKDPSQKVEIGGLNAIKIIGAPYCQTEVSKEFWDLWLAGNKDFPPLVSGALFFAKNGQSVKSVAEENKDRKTGLEKVQAKDYKLKVDDGK